MRTEYRLPLVLPGISIIPWQNIDTNFIQSGLGIMAPGLQAIQLMSVAISFV